MDGEKDIGKKTWRREREIYIYNIEREESKRRPLLGGVAVELAINQNEFRRWELFMTGLIGHLVETPLWTVSLLFLLRCTINTIAVKNRDSRKIQTVSRAHDSLYRYGYNILSISEENSYVLPPPPLPPFLLRVYISYPSKIYSAWNFLLLSVIRRLSLFILCENTKKLEKKLDSLLPLIFVLFE